MQHALAFLALQALLLLFSAFVPRRAAAGRGASAMEQTLAFFALQAPLLIFCALEAACT